MYPGVQAEVRWTGWNVGVVPRICALERSGVRHFNIIGVTGFEVPMVLLEGVGSALSVAKYGQCSFCGLFLTIAEDLVEVGTIG